MIARVTVLIASVVLASGAFARGVTIPPWVRAAIPAEVKAEKDASAVVLLDDTMVTVSPAGTHAIRYRRVVKILTTAGRDYGVATAWFDHDTKLTTLRAWSIDASGAEYEVRERDAIETTPTDFELYTDAKLKILNIPAANPGSIVAYEVESFDIPYLQQTSWQFQEAVPVLNARLTLNLPEGWSYDAHWMNHEAVPPTGNVWTLNSIPAIPDEPRRPSASAIAGRVGIHLLAPGRKALTWKDIGKWFDELAAPQSALTPPLQAKARQLVTGNDPLRPLCRFAQRDVRYVAIEIGIGGYQPHGATDVFNNRFGDCKDKTNLLRALLKENGVSAYNVMIHTSRGAVDPSFPTLAFNHVIAAIPVTAEQAKGLQAVIDHPKLGKLLFFDPTDPLTPFGQLPESLQASRGLLVTSEGGELVELPAHAPEASQLRRVAKLALDERGTLSGTVEEVHSGSLASTMRSSLQPLHEPERVRYIESRVATHLSGLTTSDVTIEHLQDPEADLVIRYTIKAPSYAQRAADMLLVRPRVLGQKAGQMLDAKRQYSYTTEGPSLQSDDIEIRMPASAKLDELPGKVDINTSALQYSSNSTFDGGVLHYRRKFAMKTFTVPQQSLGELNGAWKAILSDERASAVFK